MCCGEQAANAPGVLTIWPRSKSLTLNPAVGVPLGALHHLAATACGKSGCHPEGELRSSWKSLPANPVQGTCDG
jgi:hypothetical protein